MVSPFQVHSREITQGQGINIYICFRCIKKIEETFKYIFIRKIILFWGLYIFM